MGFQEGQDVPEEAIFLSSHRKKVNIGTEHEEEVLMFFFLVNSVDVFDE